jgi:hypothetical protein
MVIELNQTKLHSKFSKWIMHMQEYDIDIKTTKAINGIRLDELLSHIPWSYLIHH